MRGAGKGGEGTAWWPGKGWPAAPRRCGKGCPFCLIHTATRSATAPRLVRAGNLPLLLCWPLLLAFVLAALGIERLGVRLLAAEQRAVAAQRKREVGYTELKRIAARRASATGALSLRWGYGGMCWPAAVASTVLPLVLVNLCACCCCCCRPNLTCPSRRPPTPTAEHLMLLLNLANTTAAMLLPCFIILHTRAELLPGFALTMATCILWLKLISYAHCNWDYRWVGAAALPPLSSDCTCCLLELNCIPVYGPACIPPAHNHSAPPPLCCPTPPAVQRHAPPGRGARRRARQRRCAGRRRGG